MFKSLSFFGPLLLMTVFISPGHERKTKKRKKKKRKDGGGCKASEKMRQRSQPSPYHPFIPTKCASSGGFLTPSIFYLLFFGDGEGTTVVGYEIGKWLSIFRMLVYSM